MWRWAMVLLLLCGDAEAGLNNPLPVQLSYSKGEQVLILWKRQWWWGDITTVRKLSHPYRVHYQGWPNKWDEWVSDNRLAKLCRIRR